MTVTFDELKANLLRVKDEIGRDEVVDLIRDIGEASKLIFVKPHLFDRLNDHAIAFLDQTGSAAQLLRAAAWLQGTK